MQITMNVSFPLSFHCADCGRVIAMIGHHDFTIDEDTGKQIPDGFFTLVFMPHDSKDGTKPVEALEKGTLAECLYFLSKSAIEHEATRKTLELLYETFGKENVEIVPLFSDDAWPEGEQEPYEPETEDDFIQDNFPSMTRH